MYVWIVASYGSDTWSLGILRLLKCVAIGNVEKTLMDKIRNNEVIKQVGGERQLWKCRVRKRDRLTAYSYVIQVCRLCQLKAILMRKIL